MLNRTVRFLICLGLATFAGTGRAVAQDPPAEGTPAAEGTQPSASAVARANVNTDVTLRQGGIGVDGDVVVNLSSGAAAKPITVVPNLYYGVNDALTVGFAHNTLSEIFQVTSGPLPRGLCLTGSSNGCPKVYNGFSLDALFSFMRSSVMDLAAHGGLDFGSLDPFWMSLRAGVKGKMLVGPVVIVFDPSLSFALNNRSAIGNGDLLSIPARVGYLVLPQLDVGASIGLFGFLDGFGDSYAIPMGVGATYAVNGQLGVRGQFTFTNLAGNGGGADLRGISVGAVFRM